MKFLLDKDGVAFSSEFIESIYAARIYDRSTVDETHGLTMTDFFHVGAGLSYDEPGRILKEFKSDDVAANFKTAKKYFSEIVNLLDNEITFIRDESGRSVTNIKFIKKLKIEQFFSEDREFTQVLAEMPGNWDGEGTVLKEFNEEIDEIILDAKDYLADLVRTLNAKKINFVIYDDEESAINLAFVKNLVIGKNLQTGLVAVIAELIDKDEDIILKKFDSDNAEQNFQAAQNYLADLVESLNAEK